MKNVCKYLQPCNTSFEADFEPFPFNYRTVKFWLKWIAVTSLQGQIAFAGQIAIA